jgi:peptidoglycan hydrolase CwlO-like protein
VTVVDESLTQELRNKDSEIKALKESVGKLQATVDMMLQGIVERDNQYFERKYPRLKASDKTNAESREKA